MHTVVNPGTVLTVDLAGDVLSPVTGAAAERWRVATGSHVAVSFDRRSVAAPVAVLGGSFAIAQDGDTAELDIELAGGHLRGTARRSDTDDVRDAGVWSVTGVLAMGTARLSVVVGLRDHGVTYRRGAWRWLSGTGGTPRCGRQRRRTAGSPLVLDLLLHG
jgi:hypothetical protein